jgi:hypothetical protein
MLFVPIYTPVQHASRHFSGACNFAGDYWKTLLVSSDENGHEAMTLPQRIVAILIVTLRSSIVLQADAKTILLHLITRCNDSQRLRHYLEENSFVTSDLII